MSEENQSQDLASHDEVGVELNEKDQNELGPEYTVVVDHKPFGATISPDHCACVCVYACVIQVTQLRSVHSDALWSIGSSFGTHITCVSHLALR